MSVNLSPLFNGQTMFGPTGLPLAGGQLYCYQAGSSTPLTTYTTSLGTIANSNPIVLGSDGKLPNELWLTYGYSYKFILQDSSNNIIDTYDNIAGIITTIPATSPAVPSGCILIWSGSVGSIPSGFVLCNGLNSTPDLRNSFILGAGNTYTVGQTGGATSTTLTQSNLPNVNFPVTDPQHTHTATSTVTDPTHTHPINNAIGGNQGSNPGFNNGSLYSPTGYIGTTGAASTLITVATSNTASSTGISVNSGGSGTAVTTLPPYYALAFIMKS